MLRAGLTGDLGSGKSTVAAMLAQRGAIVFSSDEMARAMMHPGHAVYAEIVEHFGQSILAPDATLDTGHWKIDRKKLAALAFDPAHPRIAELNTIVHPAVLAAQAEQLAALAHTNPRAIAVIESALIFSTSERWHTRFDCILLVTAPEPAKIARFIQRAAAGRNLSTEDLTALGADARSRLALQHTAQHAPRCTVLHNDGSMQQLEAQVDAAWRHLQQLESSASPSRSGSAPPKSLP